MLHIKEYSISNALHQFRFEWTPILKHNKSHWSMAFGTWNNAWCFILVWSEQEMSSAIFFDISCLIVVQWDICMHLFCSGFQKSNEHSKHQEVFYIKCHDWVNLCGAKHNVTNPFYKLAIKAIVIIETSQTRTIGRKTDTD